MERITHPAIPAFELEIFSENQRTFGPCPDCGEMTKRVWGYVHRPEEAVATYFVEWTPGHKDQEATFDFIVGRWGEATSADDRQAVSVAFRVIDSGPSFMVQNAGDRQVGSSTLVSKALSRDEVIGTPLAELVFAICDLVYLADPRIGELRC